MRRRWITRTALGLSLGVMLIGIGLVPGGLPDFDGLEDLPLPGGADLGDHPYEVTAEFKDVVSLFPHSAVKVNDVAVGRVTHIALAEDGWTAHVTLRINGSVRLPANAYANLEQSSLLGEKYVQLVAPESMRARPDLQDTETGVTATYASNRGRLRPGDVIPVERTNRNPEVEEVFGALSLVLNGGGVEQIQTIAGELNKALGGNEPEIRSMLRQINTTAKSLDKNKEHITAALDGMNRLTSTLATRDRKIGEVITKLPPGLKVLKDQRKSLVRMLRALDSLSTVAVDTVDRTKDDIAADLRALAPVLKNLADAGDDLPKSLQVMFTYPFTDEVLSGVKGDYLNVYLRTTAAPGTRIIPPVGSGNPAASDRTAGAPLPLPSVTASSGGDA
ncbi:MlaD family protein [Streptomyces sp. KLOTTS4A1]|uniref:MlaD family protein n=1 Tax=Streptomyces sp. KLOTTS4A1 TaxID=3390996 RepID=UPI0039F5DFC9